VADDCSQDGALALVEPYSQSDPRFRTIRNAENLGWIGNVNQLLNTVDTEFFMVMPHDDVLDPHYLEILIEALQANPQAVVSFSDMEYFYLNGNNEIMSYALDVPTGLEKKRAMAMLRKGAHWWITYRGLVRTRLGGKNFRLRHNLAGDAIADLPGVLDLTMRGEFVRVPQVLYTKYVLEQSVSNHWSYGRWEHIASLVSCMRCVMEGPLSFLDKLQLVALLKLKILSQIALGVRQKIRH
jgi:glycosyltransferase involved in cell wall biosynthesis